MYEDIQDEILTILESTFDFAWRAHSEEELYRFNKLYNCLCEIETPIGRRMCRYKDSDIEHKTYFIGELYQEIIHSDDMKPYESIVQFQVLLSHTEEEYKRLIAPNSMTIKNMVKEFIPNSEVIVKIGTIGPGVYIYSDKNVSIDELYKHFDTFYFGQVISKYIVHITLHNF